MLSLNDHRQVGPDRVKRWLATITLAGTVALGGCTSGFAPMYAAPELGGSGVSDKLKTVNIATIPGRVGQQIRNELLFASTGGSDERAETRYRMEIAIRERKSQSLVNTSGNALGQVFTLYADFRLIDIADGSVALTGRSTGRAAVQKFSTIYSNVRALRDAQDRAARTVATDLRARLEAFLATAA